MIEKDIKLLEEWIEIDRKARQNSLESDFDKFCEERNVAIENILKDNSEKDKIIFNMASYIATLDIEDDICRHTGRMNECDSMAHGECESCIIKYFSKK